MQLINFLAFVGTSFLALGGVQAAENFRATCKDIKLKSNTVLQASCQKADGKYSSSSLDLNKCIVNNNWKLQCQANGNFGNSCRNCSYQDFGALYCYCDPGSNFASINLDTCIGNNNGQLFCFL
ncbi:putative effector protein [Ceratobasidium theobromae]|uniref:Putative effector protein n=1 Tax=Ceratobasidium theobromae TaxID=1582974 RepID=A0A5N5QCE1_9AGAM|nr:putative effector protein [Ceratobasidium theobromae]